MWPFDCFKKGVLDKPSPPPEPPRKPRIFNVPWDNLEEIYQQWLKHLFDVSCSLDYTGCQVYIYDDDKKEWRLINATQNKRLG